MGFFSRFFSKKIKQETVAIKDIEEWFDKETKSIVEENDKQIEAVYEQFKQESKQLLPLIEKLRKAQLRNPNIEPKLKQFMAGNRENYGRQIEIFLSEIPEFSQNFCVHFQDKLSAFGQRTARSYQILQEFFADETKQISFKIKGLDDLSKQMDQLKKREKILNINKIKERIKYLIDQILLKQGLENKIRLDKEELAKSKAELDRFENELTQKKVSSEFENYNKLVAQKEEVTEGMKRTDADLNEQFSPLKRPLRKLRKVTLDYEKLIDKYMDSPLIALIGDPDLEVLKLFQELNKTLPKLNLDQKEITKVKQRILRLDKEFLTKILKKYEEFKARSEEIYKRIEENMIVVTIEKLQNEISRLKELISKLENDIREKDEKLNKINLEMLRDEIQSKIKEILEMELVLEL